MAHGSSVNAAYRTISVIPRNSLPWYTVLIDECVEAHEELKRLFGGTFGLRMLVENSSVASQIGMEERDTPPYSLDYVLTRKFGRYSNRVHSVSDADAIFVPASCLPLRYLFKQSAAPLCLHPPAGVSRPSRTRPGMREPHMVAAAERGLLNYVLSRSYVMNSSVPIVIPLAKLPVQHRNGLYRALRSNMSQRIIFLCYDNIAGKSKHVWQLPYTNRFAYSGKGSKITFA